MTKQTLPLLPLRDIVLFPGMSAPIFVGRDISMQALKEARNGNNKNYILLTTQIDLTVDAPAPKDLHKVGVIAEVLQVINLPNNTAKILVDVIKRVKLSNIECNNFVTATYKGFPDKALKDVELLKNIVSDIMSKMQEYVELSKKFSSELLGILSEQKNASSIVNILSSHINATVQIKQNLLAEDDVITRAQELQKVIENEIVNIHTEQSLQQRVKKQIEKTQRDYYLNEQMKAIQKELDNGDEKSDFAGLEKKIKDTQLSKEALEKAESELKKLKLMNQMSSESSVIRNYLDTLLALPWNKYSKGKVDVAKAEAVLNRDHFGLDKVKERIVEYLSVLQRSNKIKGSILCLIGPPGVGKTSLVKSIAEATGRKYTKFALGGVRDEAEIRGHRKTYLGSMPGKILTLLKKVKTTNPVMLLDEIDKMGADFRGDPASALLEVLDPEQNKSFVDHYLEVEYDLSDIIFIATANSYNLPRALLDRMEIINISGYVESEKLEIAKSYLVPKQLETHHVKKTEITISDEAIINIIRYYTKESGVRGLEREIGSLVRKGLKSILSDKNLKKLQINADNLEEYLGMRKYRYGLAEKENQIGATTGLAYTEVGGDLLTIEAVSFPGKGEVKTTGKLGDVMKESATAAYSCFRTCADGLGLNYEDYKNLDIHVHVPEGAVPKDGPSAGIAIFTTIVSLMTRQAVKSSVAMTGEITLRGKVLPIGGLKEKLLAASRGGIKTVVIPQDNVKDLKDIPIDIKNSLDIIPVSNVNQVLDIALAKK